MIWILTGAVVFITAVLVFCLILSVKSKKARNAAIWTTGVTLFLVLCWILIPWDDIEYSYALKIDEEVMSSLTVDFDSPALYEGWLRPDRLSGTEESGLIFMDKEIKFSGLKRSTVTVELKYYGGEDYAARFFEPLTIDENALNDFNERRVVISPDYEYCIGETAFELFDLDDILYGDEPEGVFYSDVRIRYKNVIFDISEESFWPKSQIDKAISQLLEEYARFDAENYTPVEPEMIVESEAAASDERLKVKWYEDFLKVNEAQLPDICSLFEKLSENCQLGPRKRVMDINL